MGNAEEMKRIVETWSLAEKRAKHLCAFETLGLNIRCRKPSQDEVKKAWRALCVKMHPDRNTDCNELATEACACINLAKQHLFDVHFGGAASRVEYKHEPDREAAQAKEAEEAAAAKEAAEAAEVSALAAQQARLETELPPATEAELPPVTEAELPPVAAAAEPEAHMEKQSNKRSTASDDGDSDHHDAAAKARRV